MPSFAWEGRSRDGELKKGFLEAPTLQDAEDRVRRDLQILNAKVKKRARSINLNVEIPLLTRVSHKTLVVFTRQLATMIDAGLPLVQCLDILGQQEPDRSFQRVITNVKMSVESGSTFADALRKHPKIFDELFVNLVAAGEMGGILDTILNRLANYAEKSMKLKARVKSAMKYPATVFVVAIAITFGLLWKVIPTFAGMFKSMGKKELPALTQFMVNLSNNMLAYLPYVVGGSVLTVVAFVWFYRTERGRLIVDTVLLKVPVFGDLIRKASVAKFTRTLGTLISSGVPILDSLEIVAKTAGNKVIENGVLYTRAKISEGKSIAGPLLETGVFPKMVVQMIAVGESTGAMDIMLAKIADFYDDEVEQAVDAITSLIEPLIMVVLGGIIGFVLIGMYMPIFSMADNLSPGS
ncbi:MAG: type II secretion system F family protein [Myxococcales bacterium]|nr:type II secretion system F family protein [Myxococcales bacterium]